MYRRHKPSRARVSHLHTDSLMCKHTYTVHSQIQTHIHAGSLRWPCLYHSDAPVRLRLTCDRVQMDSQQSVSPFLHLLAPSSLPLLSLNFHLVTPLYLAPGEHIWMAVYHLKAQNDFFCK